VEANLNNQGGENDTPARNLGRYVQEINAGAAAATDMQVALIYRADRFFRGGDHEAFLVSLTWFWTLGNDTDDCRPMDIPL